MEDPLAPFADLLGDDPDAVQGPFSFQEVSDYGRLCEYSSELEDFSAWEGVFETKPELQTGVQSPESGLTQVANPTELPKPVLTDDVAHVSGSSKSRFQFSEPADMDSKLRSEMLELLNLFQAVYEKKPTIDTASLLRKCVSMCERIMERFPRLPQVVAMHEQAQAMLQALETGSPAAASSSSDSSSSSRAQLRADVKEALDRVDAEECEDPNKGRVVDGVYILNGIRYCMTHQDQEQCKDCGVDYRLLNQVHREEDQVDTTVIKEQQRLEELELQRNVVPPHSDPETPAPEPTEGAEDFQSIAKDMHEELARAREKDEADFLKSFSSFQIS